MHILTILAAILFAWPAFAQTCPSTVWPACTVKFDDDDRLEATRDEHPEYLVANLPTCDANAAGRTVYVTDGDGTSDCTVGLQSNRNQCNCDGTTWLAALAGAGGTHPVDLASDVTGTLDGDNVEGATASQKGVLERATLGEVSDGTTNLAAITPLSLRGADLEQGDMKLGGHLTLRRSTLPPTLPTVPGSPDVKDASYYYGPLSTTTYDNFSWCADNFDTPASPAPQTSCSTTPTCSDGLCDSNIGSADPTTPGQTLVIRAQTNKTNFLCANQGNPTGKLICGTETIVLDKNDWISFTSADRFGTGNVQWYLNWVFRQEDNYGSRHLTAYSEQTFGTWKMSDVELTGTVDLGLVEYFLEDDATPDISSGTLFKSWECADLYDVHCVDLYDSRDGEPCGGDIQCSGAPDALCDSDAQSALSVLPQRAGSPDALCDADGVTAFPASAPSQLTITDFDGGDDGQIIYVIASEQELELFCSCVDVFDTGGPPQTSCAGGSPCPDSLCDDDGSAVPGSSNLVCGTVNPILNTDETATFFLNGDTNSWHLLALEEFSDVSKASLGTANTFTAQNTFNAAVTLGSVLDFGVWNPVTGGSGDASLGNLFIVGDATTITTFTNGTEGQQIYLSGASPFFPTIDCTGTILVCGTGDITLLVNETIGFIYQNNEWQMNAYFNKARNYSVLPIAATDVTFENLSANGDIGFGASQVPEGDEVAPLAGPTFTGEATFADVVVAGIHQACDSTETWGASDATPDVASGNCFRSNTSTTPTITNFDCGGGVCQNGHWFIVRGGWSGTGTIYDCSGSADIHCGSIDIRTKLDDFMLWFQQNGDWYMLSYMDASTSNLANAMPSDWIDNGAAGNDEIRAGGSDFKFIGGGGERLVIDVSSDPPAITSDTSIFISFENEIITGDAASMMEHWTQTISGTTHSPSGVFLLGCSTYYYTNTGAVTATLGDAVAGACICLHDFDATAALSVDVQSGDQIFLDGTGIGAGDKLLGTTDGGEWVCLKAKSTTDWVVEGRSRLSAPDWSDGGP